LTGFPVNDIVVGRPTKLPMPQIYITPRDGNEHSWNDPS
jgi:hypothetical protein